jgi:hypothetical protein
VLAVLFGDRAEEVPIGEPAEKADVVQAPARSHHWSNNDWR